MKILLLSLLFVVVAAGIYPPTAFHLVHFARERQRRESSLMSAFEGRKKASAVVDISLKSATEFTDGVSANEAKKCLSVMTPAEAFQGGMQIANDSIAFATRFKAGQEAQETADCKNQLFNIYYTTDAKNKWRTASSQRFIQYNWIQYAIQYNTLTAKELFQKGVGIADLSLDFAIQLEQSKTAKTVSECKRKILRAYYKKDSRKRMTAINASFEDTAKVEQIQRSRLVDVAQLEVDLQEQCDDKSLPEDVIANYKKLVKYLHVDGDL